MRWFRLFCVLGIGTLVGGAGILYWAYNALSTPLQRTEPTLITVAPGQAFAHVARDLFERGVIKNPKLLRYYAVITQQAARVQAGEYEIPVDVSARDVLQQLVAGDVTQYAFTIVEGLTVSQMLVSLRQHPKLQNTSSGLDEAKLMALLGKANVSPEGQFLADTYHFPAGTSALELLNRAHTALGDALAEEWQQRAVGVPLATPYEALILASIIEKETGVAEEREKIAGVFSRRLQRGMRLQTDPTVIYGLGDAYQGNLTRRHLKQDTPYNTYMRRGLPPTPIALVGRASIQAALQPEQASTLYFVAKGDGSHFFSDTLEQHNRAVRQYQLNRANNYRSSPK